MDRDTSRVITLVQLRMAFGCIAVAVLAGAVGVLHYVPEISNELNGLGLTLPKLRPVHTTFTSLWIFGGAVAVIYHYLARQHGGLRRADVRRFWFHTGCWLTAGAGVLVTLLLGVTSGREYLGFHPAFALPLLAGWLALAWTWLGRLRHGFWGQPVYVYMWTVGILYFVYTFVEAYAFLLPGVWEVPVRDLQLQWKSCGTLVGSFNFLVYGALVYVTERMTRDPRYGQSSTAFWLFGVGCLNSFTNYVHHTYHLPQDAVVKWVSFVVSMLEAVILLKIAADIVKALRAGRGAAGYDATVHYFGSVRGWTAVVLVTSILMSVPNLNSVVHGTQVITGHAMGAEFGVDTLVLFGAATFLLGELLGRDAACRERLHGAGVRRQVTLLNWSAGALVGWLTASGIAHGWSRYHGEPLPGWVDLRWVVFPVTGLLFGAMLVATLWRLRPLLAVPLRETERAAEAVPAE